MNAPEVWTVIVGAVAIAGQVINLVMILRVRVAVLEMKDAIMDKSDEKYMAAPVCVVRMKDHERRLGHLEQAI